METSAQRCWRILAALEDLVHQESASLAKRDWMGAETVQQRAAPLVDFLAAHGPASADDAALRERIATLQQRRAETSRSLNLQIAQAKSELQQAQAARRRLGQIAPAYGGGSAPPRHRLQAQG
jgi:hypothetical protein